MRITFTCTLAMFAILAFTSTVRSQSIDCQCDGEFSVGDRVVTTVDNPGSGNNLPAGSVGTVVCGTTALPYMVVSFDDWTDGFTGDAFCVCGDDLGPDTSHWYLLCDQIELVAVVPSIPVGWGWNNQGQSEVPDQLLVDISGGGIHSLGLLEDGTAVAWGSNNSGQCDVPEGESFVQVSAGQLHSLGLREDGTVLAWGRNNAGQCDVPENETFIQVAAGFNHSLGLRPDGTVLQWGSGAGEIATPPLVQIATCGGLSAGIVDNGQLFAWDGSGSVDVPAGSRFVQVAVGAFHGIALEEDGTAVTWGQNDQGQCNVPSGSTFTQVAAGLSHSMGILENETVIAWGDNTFGQCDVPESMFVSRIDGGHQHSLGLLIWGEGDTDLDGTPDNQDPCPLDPDNDIDGDGYCSDADVFPDDPNEWLDSDGDGLGDNADACPFDPTETDDSDNDGVCDNGDIFPEDPLEWADLDGDGIGDNEDTAPRGACCVHTYCHQTTANSCAGFGGTWLGVDGVCEDCPAVCEGDTDGDDDVDIEDLLNTIGNWGMCP